MVYDGTWLMHDAECRFKIDHPQAEFRFLAAGQANRGATEIRIESAEGRKDLSPEARRAPVDIANLGAAVGHARVTASESPKQFFRQPSWLAPFPVWERNPPDACDRRVIQNAAQGLKPTFDGHCVVVEEGCKCARGMSETEVPGKGEAALPGRTKQEFMTVPRSEPIPDLATAVNDDDDFGGL
jgi:hypothetical protein